MSKSGIPAGANHNLFLRGKNYWCRYEIGGVEVRRSLHTTDVKKARKARDELISKAEDARAGREETPVIRWEMAVAEYLLFQDTQVKSGALSAKTVQRYNISLINLSEVLENQALTAITSATILDYVTARRQASASASTIKNDLTAWSKLMAFAVVKTWITHNPVKDFDRSAFVGHDADALNPPLDVELAEVIEEVRAWHPVMAELMIWLRETGMRLDEALSIHRSDIHPCGTKATLRRGVKRNNKVGSKTRTIDLGRGAALLPELAKHGRLFAGVWTDVDATSSRFGQWKRQRAARAERAGLPAPREFRLHDLRHAFAIASLIDDPTCVYKLKLHLGHGSVTTTEGYVRFLAGEGAQRQYLRRPDLFGSLCPPVQKPAQKNKKPPLKASRNGR